MAEEDLGLKPEETGEDEPASDETTPPVSEDLNTPETPEAKADKLLADGTSPKKDIKVSKEKFDDRNEKAKLYEAFAPILEKVRGKPELVEELLEISTKGTLEERVGRMEEERRTQKRREMKEAITEALGKWSSFEQDWPEIREDVNRLNARGHSYREAVRRMYLALHPEEAQAEAERQAQEGVKTLGTFSPAASYSPRPVKAGPETKLSEADKRVGRALGYKDEEYAKLLDKHSDYLETKGFNVSLD